MVLTTGGKTVSFFKELDEVSVVDPSSSSSSCSSVSASLATFVDRFFGRISSFSSWQYLKKKGMKLILIQFQSMTSADGLLLTIRVHGSAIRGVI